MRSSTEAAQLLLQDFGLQGLHRHHHHQVKQLDRGASQVLREPHCSTLSPPSGASLHPMTTTAAAWTSPLCSVIMYTICVQCVSSCLHECACIQCRCHLVLRVLTSVTYIGQERGQIPHTPPQSFGNRGYFCPCVLCGYQVLTGRLCVSGEPGHARLGKVIPPSTGGWTQPHSVPCCVAHVSEREGASDLCTLKKLLNI